MKFKLSKYVCLFVHIRLRVEYYIAISAVVLWLCKDIRGEKNGQSVEMKIVSELSRRTLMVFKPCIECADTTSKSVLA